MVCPLCKRRELPGRGMPDGAGEALALGIGLPIEAGSADSVAADGLAPVPVPVPELVSCRSSAAIRFSSSLF